MPMEYIKVGELSIPQVGLGTYTHRGELMDANVAVAKRCGCALFDTALLYQNESDLAAALRKADFGSDAIVQTKVPPARLIGKRKYLRLDRIPVAKAFQDSVRNLQGLTPSIYLFHSYGRGCEQPYRQLIKLQRQGRVSVIGICNCDIPQLQSIYNHTGEYPMILQTEVHPYLSQKPLLDFCRERGIAVEARSPFAHGDALEEWLHNAVLTHIAHDHGRTVPQVILRWLVQQGLIVIPRTTNPIHMQENLALFDFALAPSQMQQIDALNRNRSFGVRSQRN